MNPRLGFLLFLLVFVAGSGAGYLALQGQPSADEIQALSNPCNLQPGPVETANTLATIDYAPRRVSLGDSFSATVTPSNSSVRKTTVYVPEGMLIPGKDTISNTDSSWSETAVNSVAPSKTAHLETRALRVTNQHLYHDGQNSWNTFRYAATWSLGAEGGTASYAIVDDKTRLVLVGPDGATNPIQRFVTDPGSTKAYLTLAGFPEVPGVRHLIQARVTGDGVDDDPTASGGPVLVYEADTDGVVQISSQNYDRVDIRLKPQYPQTSLVAEATTPDLCNNRASTEFSFAWLHASALVETVAEDIPADIDTLLAKVTVSVTSDDDQPVQNAVVNWQNVQEKLGKLTGVYRPKVGVAPDALMPITDPALATIAEAKTDPDGKAALFIRWRSTKDDPSVNLSARAEILNEPKLPANSPLKHWCCDRVVTATDVAFTLAAQLPKPTLACTQTIPPEGWQEGETPAPIIKPFTAGQDAKIAQPFHGTLDCVVSQRNPTDQPVTLTLKAKLSPQWQVPNLAGGNWNADGIVTWQVTIPANDDLSKTLTGMKWQSNRDTVQTTAPPGDNNEGQ